MIDRPQSRIHRFDPIPGVLFVWFIGWLFGALVALLILVLQTFIWLRTGAWPDMPLSSVADYFGLVLPRVPAIPGWDAVLQFIYAQWVGWHAALFVPGLLLLIAFLPLLVFGSLIVELFW